MNKIAFTSDQHYGHKNILRLCNRPFDNIYHHNEALIANHNSIVYDDTFVLLQEYGTRVLPCSALYHAIYLYGMVVGMVWFVLVWLGYGTVWHGPNSTRKDQL